METYHSKILKSYYAYRCRLDFKAKYPLHYAMVKNDIKISVFQGKKRSKLDLDDLDSWRKTIYRNYSPSFEILELTRKTAFIGRYTATFVAYNVYLKEENTNMSGIGNHIMKYFKTPPEYIMQRQDESLHLFMDVVKQFKEEGGEIRTNNAVSTLMNNNLISHPKVHRGYYESKRSGVLYVKDCFTGESIRKDESVLLCTGEFTRYNSANVIKEPSITQKNTLMEAIDGYPSALAAFKDKFFFEKETFSYIPFDISLFKKTIHPRNLASTIYEQYLNYCNNNGFELVPESAEDISFGRFCEAFRDTSPSMRPNVNPTMYFPDSDQHKANSYLIPSDSVFLPNYLIRDQDGFGANMSNAIRSGLRPAWHLNSSNGIKWNTGGGNLGGAQILSGGSSCPFDFLIICSQGAQVRANRKSANNDGHLLSYSTRVNDLKVSFLMTPEEKVVFDRYDKDHKAAVKQHKADRVLHESTVGTAYTVKPPVKHPSQEPIYLGIEIEVVARGDSRSEAGVRNIIKSIADSSFGDHVIAKSDGSIGSYGLEIVTIPATLAYHKLMFEKHFFVDTNTFHKKIMSTEQCGIHVHLAKNAFTPLDLGKFMAFINDKKNSSFIDAMSNRTQNMYCVRPSTLGKNAKGVDTSAKLVKAACRDGAIKNGLSFRRLESFNRRQSVNLQNAQTVEVRIFKSSADKNNILRKIEFCESLVKFVREHSMQQMTIYDYVNFMLDKANKSTYPYVIRWLASKGYIDHERRMVKYLDKEEKKTRNKLVHIYSVNKVPNPNPQPKKETK